MSHYDNGKNVQQMANRGTTLANHELRRPNNLPARNDSLDEITNQARNLTLDQHQPQPLQQRAPYNPHNVTPYSFHAVPQPHLPPTNMSNFIAGGDVSWTSQDQKAKVQTNEIKSNLSPFAAEFVPRFAMTFTQPPPVATNGAWNDYCCQSEPTLQASDHPESEDFVALSELREFIDRISVKPNRYESLLLGLTDVMNNWIAEEEIVIESVVNLIVDQAIMDVQFRYNGVRLCIHLMENLKVVPSKGSFAALLFQRCQREHSRREALVKATDGGTYLRGLTLFIGDLFARCNGRNAHELADCLPQLLDTLISHASEDNLKCVCQVLKLCGSIIDNYFTEKKSDVMPKLMKNLEVNNTHGSKYTKELVTNVIEMQKRGWSAIPSTSVAAHNPYLNTYVAPVANEYTEEYNGYSDEEEMYPSYDFGSCGDEEDNDVCQAFEEFLKSSGQN